MTTTNDKNKIESLKSNFAKVTSLVKIIHEDV